MLYIDANHKQMLTTEFHQVLNYYQIQDKVKNTLWAEIENEHTDSSRHYHNLNHLNHLYDQLLKVKSEIKDWQTVILAIVYHDVVYKSTKSNNEEKSAEFATKRLQELEVPQVLIERVQEIILATKSHNISTKHDINLFTDADISILGQDWESYLVYTQQIRKEYAIYPDIMYKAGRKKVLTHFLEMNRLYKTAFFFDLYEETARLNIKKELRLLS